VLKLTNISTMIGGFKVIEDLSLTIEKGEFVALLGGNGAGKSSLFRTIAGILHPVQGTVEFNGKATQRLPANKMVAMGLALCPEGRHLFPHLPVYKNLMLGAYARRDGAKEIQATLEKVYELFPILVERKKQLAGTFSGGQQQMLAIGRAMMSNPDMLLLDEPSIGLAPMVVQTIAEAIKVINEMGTTVFLSEQNANMALMITRRGYVMETGRIVLEGLSQNLLKDEKVKKAYLGL
jgi:branched-chain amino acid transport system ATP-binding protein